MMKKHEKVIVFIDGSNIFHEARRKNFKIDYYKLVTELVGNRILVRPYFYTSIKIPQNSAQYKFHQALKHQGFTVITKPLKKRNDLWIEKGIEIAIATDILIMAFRDLYDTAILVSGDHDFVPIIDEVKRLGKRMEVAAFDSTIAFELKNNADKYISINALMEEITLEI